MFIRMVVVLGLLASGALAAADLSLPAGVVVHKTAALNLTLAGAGGDLAGFQCDLEFDSDALEIAFAAGPASMAAGKSLVVTAPAPGDLADPPARRD